METDFSFPRSQQPASGSYADKHNNST